MSNGELNGMAKLFGGTQIVKILSIAINIRPEELSGLTETYLIRQDLHHTHRLSVDSLFL